FFQAEDGIRDLYVTGVQTCALPISDDGAEQRLRARGAAAVVVPQRRVLRRIDRARALAPGAGAAPARPVRRGLRAHDGRSRLLQIGRASCRERVLMWVDTL